MSGSQRSNLGRSGDPDLRWASFASSFRTGRKVKGAERRPIQRVGTNAVWVVAPPDRPDLLALASGRLRARPEPASPTGAVRESSRGLGARRRARAPAVAARRPRRARDSVSEARCARTSRLGLGVRPPQAAPSAPRPRLAAGCALQRVQSDRRERSSGSNEPGRSPRSKSRREVRADLATATPSAEPSRTDQEACCCPPFARPASPVTNPTSGRPSRCKPPSHRIPGVPEPCSPRPAAPTDPAPSTAFRRAISTAATALIGSTAGPGRCPVSAADPAAEPSLARPSGRTTTTIARTSTLPSSSCSPPVSGCANRDDSYA